MKSNLNQKCHTLNCLMCGDQTNHLMTEVLFHSMIIQCNCHIITVLHNTWLMKYLCRTFHKSSTVLRPQWIQGFQGKITTTPQVSNWTLPSSWHYYGHKTVLQGFKSGSYRLERLIFYLDQETQWSSLCLYSKIRNKLNSSGFGS